MTEFTVDGDSGSNTGVTGTAPVLEVASLATGYGDLRAVWDVSLLVHPGKITLLLGRNGAGKTTTLLAIAGLLPVQGGAINFNATTLKGSPQRRVGQGIAFVPEGKRVFHQLSVTDNLLVGGFLLNRRDRVQELRSVCELFPLLHDRRDVRADALSGGQQQMLAIGQALMARPKLLLLDEPSAGLAPRIMSDVIEALLQLASTGVAVLLVEQVVDIALPVAERVVLIDGGRSVYTAVGADPRETRGVVERYLSGNSAAVASGSSSG